MNDQIVACRCLRICATLGVELGQWCRYHTSDLPPPGMARFDPKESWCPPGVRANIMMLAYLVSRREDPDGEIPHVLDRVRQWVRAYHEADTHLSQGESNERPS